MTTTGQAAVIGLYGMASQDLSYDPAFLLLLFVLLIILPGRGEMGKRSVRQATRTHDWKLAHPG